MQLLNSLAINQTSARRISCELLPTGDVLLTLHRCLCVLLFDPDAIVANTLQTYAVDGCKPVGLAESAAKAPYRKLSGME
ncbi:hypothetical protein [Camelimonas lactis]|uniref:hypothetical protein n=1 Tax=Camelimonas lactis TaxID=659006 RepID=UPI00104BD32D|nr:hypothetical protein [Camelimonas lactis]